MSTPRILFLAFDGCPLALAARSSLRRALQIVGPLEYEEIDILDPETPDDLRGWGSPTILVNGRDVTGASKGDSVGCRIYASPDKVPDAETIADFIRKAKSI